MLQCDGERTGLFSMIVLPWPQPLQLAVEPYQGSDWQTLIPPGSPDPEADALLLQLIYAPHAYPANLVRRMADYSDCGLAVPARPLGGAARLPPPVHPRQPWLHCA